MFTYEQWMAESEGTFRRWMAEHLDIADVETLATHGARAGIPGLTYYGDTTALYHQFEDEIWACARDGADYLGGRSMGALQYIAAIVGGHAVNTPENFKQHAVWMLAQAEAPELLEYMRQAAA